MALHFLSGFESGDSSEITSLSGTASISSSAPITGAYSLLCNPTGTGTGLADLSTNDIGSIAAIRFSFLPITLPSANSEEISDFVGLRVRIGSDGKLAVYNGTTLDTTGSAVLSAGTVYQIRITTDFGAGNYKVYVNDTLDIQAAGLASSGVVRLGKVTNRNGETVSYKYDDVMIDKGSASIQTGTVKLIARQGKAGTPTNNAWTKTGLTTARECWSETPFGTTNFCVSPGTGDPLAQTMLEAAFSSGTDPIGASDTIVAHKTGAVAKRSSGNGRTHKLRTRLNSVNYDSDALGLGTGDAWREHINPFGSQPTRAQLDAAEIGGEKSGGAAGQTFTIEDCWLMVAYQPATAQTYQLSLSLAAAAAVARSAIGTFPRAIAPSAQAAADAVGGLLSQQDATLSADAAATPSMALSLGLATPLQADAALAPAAAHGVVDAVDISGSAAADAASRLDALDDLVAAADAGATGAAALDMLLDTAVDGDASATAAGGLQLGSTVDLDGAADVTAAGEALLGGAVSLQAIADATTAERLDAAPEVTVEAEGQAAHEAVTRLDETVQADGAAALDATGGLAIEGAVSMAVTADAATEARLESLETIAAGAEAALTAAGTVAMQGDVAVASEATFVADGAVLMVSLLDVSALVEALAEAGVTFGPTVALDGAGDVIIDEEVTPAGEAYQDSFEVSGEATVAAVAVLTWQADTELAGAAGHAAAAAVDIAADTAIEAIGTIGTIGEQSSQHSVDLTGDAAHDAESAVTHRPSFAASAAAATTVEARLDGIVLVNLDPSAQVLASGAVQITTDVEAGAAAGADALGSLRVDMAMSVDASPALDVVLTRTVHGELALFCEVSLDSAERLDAAGIVALIADCVMEAIGEGGTFQRIGRRVALAAASAPAQIGAQVSKTAGLASEATSSSLAASKPSASLAAEARFVVYRDSG